MDTAGHNVTTITILDVSLSLVHIPRSRLTELIRPVLKQLLRKNPKFLNLTANEIELSLFVEEDELADFELVARRDRRKQRARDRADSVSTSGARRHRHPPRLNDAYEPVEVSFEKWRVLQIDSHDANPSDSGSRVRELSAPLAAAGISILYQSSHLSDFIFVKASRLAEVMKLLDAEGFTLYNTDLYEMPSSPFMTGSANVTNDKQYRHLQDEMSSYALVQPGSPGTMSPAVFSRTRSPSTSSLAALSNAVSKQGTIEELTSSTLTMHRSMIASSPMSSSATSRASRTPKKSLSPTAAPVEVLGPDLACVGLNESAADVWAVKIITLVGYPELIPTPKIESTTVTVSSHVPYDERRNSLAESLYGSAQNVPHTRLSSPDRGPLSPSAVFSHDAESSDGGKDVDRNIGPHSSPCSSPDSMLTSSSSDAEEYFSSSPPYHRTRADSGSTPSLVSATSQSSARSLPERLDDLRKSERRPHLSKITMTRAERDAVLTESIRSRDSRAGNFPNATLLRVPFFSFTRTAEGSSLTTDIQVLSALFGLDERHMIICSGTLLDAGDELNARAAVERRYGTSEKRGIFDFDNSDMTEEVEVAPGTMKCLQIDLQRFGLDKYGLVNRFSRVLEENGINHMYSSTYKTANLLVDKASAGRAQSLLRSC